ncbi:GD17092 [Drosophila simulans]|uniref:GD17092 n=2 Tax=Drosophila simulans TaxID=7240 RepID=B4R406_DROSI|nr:GD17092 [Drosophila simulans]
MFRAFAFTVLFTALTLSQGHRDDYLRFPDPGNIPRYNQRPCGPRVCGKSGHCYRSFESICDFNDYNLKMIFSGQELFELTEPI